MLRQRQKRQINDPILEQWAVIDKGGAPILTGDLQNHPNISGKVEFTSDEIHQILNSEQEAVRREGTTTDCTFSGVRYVSLDTSQGRIVLGRPTDAFMRHVENHMPKETIREDDLAEHPHLARTVLEKLFPNHKRGVVAETAIDVTPAGALPSPRC